MVGGEVLQMQEISATAGDYLAAVAAVESQVPHGWRVLYVRADDAPVPDLPATGTAAESSPGSTDSGSGDPHA